MDRSTSRLERSRILCRGVGAAVNWVFVGVGAIACQYLVGAVCAQQENDVRRMVSGPADRAAAFAGTHRTPLFGTDLAEALADPALGAVCISPADEKHHGPAMAALAAGKPVLCELPLATAAGNAQDMVRAAEKAGVLPATGNHLHSAGSLRAIRDAIPAEKVTKSPSQGLFHAVALPVHLRGGRLDNPAAGGGVSAGLTGHNSGTVRFLPGEDPVPAVVHVDVTGMGRGLEDSAMPVRAMPRRATGFSHESFIHPFAASGPEAPGTQGSIPARAVLPQDPGEQIDLITAPGRARAGSDRCAIDQGVVREFCAAVKGRQRPAAPGRDGVKSPPFAAALCDAARTGRHQAANSGETA